MLWVLKNCRSKLILMSPAPTLATSASKCKPYKAKKKALIYIHRADHHFQIVNSLKNTLKSYWNSPIARSSSELTLLKKTCNTKYLKIRQ